MEKNKIYNEDCLVTMRRMPDNYIDLTVTSPPYDNLRDYNGYSFEFEAVAKELYRVTKEGGVVVWVVGDATINGTETGTSFKQALYFKEIGFNIHDTMIYAKNNPIPTPLNSTRYRQDFEYMFVFSKGRPKNVNLITEKTLGGGSKKKGYRYSKNGEKKSIQGKINDVAVIGNIWFFNVGAFGNKDDKTEHPASFPEELAKRHIFTWSNKGGIVYDPFMGSGTTAKAAHLLGRNWIGSEISKEYVIMAEKRLEPYLKQLTLDF